MLRDLLLVHENGSLYCLGPYVSFGHVDEPYAEWGDKRICLDGDFSVEDLEEVVRLMKEAAK